MKKIHKQKDTEEFINMLIETFRDKTSCGIQYNNSPCNTCFHNIDADFNHICWLILLYLRGDYNKEEIIKSIREELLK